MRRESVEADWRLNPTVANPDRLPKLTQCQTGLTLLRAGLLRIAAGGLAKCLQKPSADGSYKYRAEKESKRRISWLLPTLPMLHSVTNASLVALVRRFRECTNEVVRFHR